MSKQLKIDESKNEGKGKSKLPILLPTDPLECPFREFKDSELGADLWGLGPAACRTFQILPKVASKPTTPTVPYVWVDEQTQPLPRSVRQYLHGWIRAEELASSRWDAEAVVYEESNNKMSLIDMQVSHAQVLLRSAFCRKVLSACFILEKMDNLPAEHLNDHFSFVYGPEGWRAKYHIYSPGLKYGGGLQHKPVLSKNGCYLVRLYYVGAWRCVWVSDQVPVDTSGAPLLPFSPLMSHQHAKVKGIPATVTSHYVQLWPLLICKALLKLAAPDMASDEDEENVEDEPVNELDMLHVLIGCMSMVYPLRDFANQDELWELLRVEVANFMWDDDDETVASTIKSATKKTPSTKKAANKEIVSKHALVSALIRETEDYPVYALPGITPCHEMDLIITMIRDVPLRKPLPEPIVPLWKTYRWVEWARHHGLYDSYDCPRTQHLKVTGLMKLSYAPHLLDVQSTQSLTMVFREEHEKKDIKKNPKDAKENIPSNTEILRQKEELKEWVLYASLYALLKAITIHYFPSMFEFASCGSNPPPRTWKPGAYRPIDIVPSKSAPLYIAVDNPETINLKISINMIHPRVLSYSGVPITDFIEKAYVLLEVFEWFEDKELAMPKAYVDTRGYYAVTVKFQPGRHYCRLWVHSRMHWHVALISDSNLLLGSRDAIIGASVKECSWTNRFLSYLGNSFLNWIRVNRNVGNITMYDRDFYSSYQPDLEWDPKEVGHPKCFLHWMFRQAVQSLLSKRLGKPEYEHACNTLRRYFMDPDFGFPPKPAPPRNLRELAETDPCDCKMPECEEFGEEEVVNVIPDEQDQEDQGEEIPIVSPELMKQLLKPLDPQTTSNLCDFATEEVPCPVLRVERDKEIVRHEAATFLQSRWRGYFARKVLKQTQPVTSDVQKLVMDNAFGHLEVLSQLMNEFFYLYPGVKHAYSISSALSGHSGLQQHTGTSPMTAACKWIPYFQGVFYCHYPVKVHFDVHSNLQYSTVAVYNNDSGEQMPQAYNAHITFDFEPNMFGYTVIGHGSLKQPMGHSSEAHWQLTILSSIENVFHICDNPDTDFCTISPLVPSSKLHLDEFFVPNRRNILGGVQISVTKIEAVCFRAEATSPDLEMEAVLRSTTLDGEVEEFGRCHGTGEIFWPYIRLKPAAAYNLLGQKKSYSHAYLPGSMHSFVTTKSPKTKAKPSSAGAKENKSGGKMETLKDGKPAPPEPKLYTIEVTAPNGWALTVDQWRRVVDVRNSIEAIKINEPTTPVKGKGKDKASSAKDKKEKEKPADKEDKERPMFTVPIPLPGDAFVVLECSTALGGGAFTKRDDERDILFALERRSWAIKEPGRNTRGAAIRAAFKEAFLVPEAVPMSPLTDNPSPLEEEEETSDDSKLQFTTPVTESGLVDVEVEPEEEYLYYVMPDILRDKFEPLYFVPLCTKAMEQEENVLLTSEMMAAAKKERQMHFDSALERMQELQTFNEKHVLGRQRRRQKLLEKLFVDSQWSSDLTMALEERDEAIAKEVLERQLSAAKKKADAKMPSKPGTAKPAAGKKK